MNPVSTLRFRRFTALCGAAWALLAVALSVTALLAPARDLALPVNLSFVAGSAVVHWATPEARRAGLSRGDRVLAIDGRPVLGGIGGDLLQEGEPDVYRVEKRDGRVIEVALPPARVGAARRPVQMLLHAGLLAVAVLYLAIGSGVWWSRRERQESWAFLLFCCAMAVELGSAIRVDLVPWSAARTVANFPLLGATAFHFFTTYPLEPDWVVRHRRVRALPYLGAFALGALVLCAEPLGVPLGPVTSLAVLYGVGLSLGALGVLARERRRAREAGLGDRADVVWLAALVGFLPLLLVFLTELLLQVPTPWYAAMLWVAVFPAIVGYGMVRKQLFEFRVVAKSSAAYGAATLAITGVFATLITFADVVVELVGLNLRSVQVAFLFLAILAFDPLRNRMQRLVDNLFDRDRSRYRVAVREISEAMVSMLSLREIGDRILLALTDTMGVERAMVLLFDESDRVLRAMAWRGDWDEEHLGTEIPAGHPIWKHLWMRREELSRVDFDDEPDTESREACWDVFDTLEIELLVPILFGVDLLGVIAVGRKISGDRLAADDRQLLRTLANQSSIAIENAKAFDEIAKLNETLEARVEERTRELRDTQDQLMQAEKLKSLGQLVAGVAHELNNPIGYVHANMQLLDEYVRKLVEGQKTESDTERIRDAIEKLIRRSREGTERVKQIVQDLRTFSRMDHAELQEADLHEEIERTLGLMEPQFKGGVRVEKQYGDIPRVRCYPGQLNQVFLNLLMNSCDALGGEGTITIRTARGPLGVRLEFGDDGPGIPPELQGRLFDPFFTTKPVGKGTGLGLSLSHGIIERHGGRIHVESHPGRGATFVIELPLDAATPEE